MAEVIFSIPAANPLPSVTLYELEIDGAWEEQGVGYCIYESGEHDEADEIQVISGEDHSTLLWRSKVKDPTEYHRPQDTLIAWTEGNRFYMVLSFEAAHDCEDLWQKINKDNDSDATTKPPSDSDYGDTSSSEDAYETGLLPDPEISNLSQITQALATAITDRQNDRYVSFIIGAKYIKRLIELFTACEGQGRYPSLYALYTIMKAIIMLEDDGIIRHIVSDDNYLGVMGMLEFDPDEPTIRSKHREALAKIAATEPVVPINDEETLDLIHKTYRIRYIKDFVFRGRYNRSFDGMLESMISSNDREIICNILRNTELLTELSRIFKDPNATDEQKIGPSKFILQLCNNCKGFQAENRASFYKDLCSYGFLDMFGFSLSAEPLDVCTTACDILCLVITTDPVFMRSKLVEDMAQHEPKSSLMGKIIDRFSIDTDWDLKLQLSEIIRLLLDLTSRSNLETWSRYQEEGSRHEASEEFIYVFFDEFAASTFLRPFDAIDRREMKLEGSVDTLELTMDQGNAFQYHCELLCLAVEQHSDESMVLFTKGDIIAKVMQLYRCQRGPVKHSALKFIRACVGVRDKFYHKILIGENAFEPTIRLLLDTGGRDNLLNSACLELFEFIRRENIVRLVNHLITQYGTILDTLTYVATFNELRLRYDRNQRTPGLVGQSPSSGDDEEIRLTDFSVESNTPSPTADASADTDNDDGSDDDLDRPLPLPVEDDGSEEGRRVDEDPVTSAGTPLEEENVSDQDAPAIREPQETEDRKRKRDHDDDGSNSDQDDDAPIVKSIKH